MALSQQSKSRIKGGSKAISEKNDLHLFELRLFASRDYFLYPLLIFRILILKLTMGIPWQSHG